jgi:hypothetical protein
MNGIITAIIICIIIGGVIIFIICRPSPKGKGLSKPLEHNRQLRTTQSERQDSDSRTRERVKDLKQNNGEAEQLINDAREILERAKYIEPMGEDK